MKKTLKEKAAIKEQRLHYREENVNTKYQFNIKKIRELVVDV